MTGPPPIPPSPLRGDLSEGRLPDLQHTTYLSDVDLELDHGEEGNDIWPWFGDEEQAGGYDDGDSDSDSDSDDTQRHSFVPVCSHIRMGLGVTQHFRISHATL